jgi:pyruvate formate lyase activating enzyme
LNLIGRWVTVDEVLAEVSRDALYFESSGGGLTLSGGEPLAQPDFAAELLWRYKHEEKGDNTAVETCGFVEWPVLETLSAEVDLFLYDIKHMDPAEHLRLTGRDNRLILENARRLAQAGRALVIRLPLIAGINDSRENLEATAEFALSLAGVTRIDILPYHRLGEPKYQRLEREYHLGGLPSLPAERVAQVLHFLEQRGLEVRVGG